MIRENEEFTLKELFLLFLPKIWIIILCGVILAGAIGAYSFLLQDDEYTSSATIYVYKERANDTASNTYYDSITSQKMVKTYSIVLKSRKFLEKLATFLDSVASGTLSAEDIAKYGLTEEDIAKYTITPEMIAERDLTPKSISSVMDIKQVDETEVFDVFFTSDDQNLTYNVLLAMTHLAPTEIKGILSSAASDVKIIDEPEMPKSPDSKHTVRNAILGFFVGVILAMAAVFLANLFDVVIHDKKKIEDNFDIPVLGVIPRQSITAAKNGGNDNGV